MSDRTDADFELWRQDDHGHRFLVGRFPTRAAAEQRLIELTRTPHKQSYWVTASENPPEQASCTKS
jgi:hypothetical protein